VKEPRPAALEGDDPDPEEDEFLSALVPLNYVDDEEVQAVIRDALGGGLHGSRAQIVLARFKRERWRIIKEG
jgi:hypothetical protein